VSRSEVRKLSRHPLIRTSEPKGGSLRRRLSRARRHRSRSPARSQAVPPRRRQVRCTASRVRVGSWRSVPTLLGMDASKRLTPLNMQTHFTTISPKMSTYIDSHIDHLYCQIYEHYRREISSYLPRGVCDYEREAKPVRKTTEIPGACREPDQSGDRSNSSDRQSLESSDL
jgi:hypothetical protein